MNFHNDNFNSNNNSLSLSFTGKGLRDTSNSLNNYLKTGIGFQLLSNSSNYKEFVIADTSNINSNYFASLRIAVEKSQISLKSITSNNIIQPLIINSNIFITSNIGIGRTNPLYNIDAVSNINANDYFIKERNISNIFINSNNLQTLSNLTNSWTKISSSIIYTNSNVGINTSPSPLYNLDVGGNINFTGNLSKNGIIFNNFSGKFSDLDGKPDITWKLDINKTHIYNLNAGNVGINQTNPSYNLDVNGNINFTGNLTKNGNKYGGDWDFIDGKPDLHKIAESGSWLDLVDKPPPTGLNGVVIKWSDIADPPPFAEVARTGNYSNLSGLPTLFTQRFDDLKQKPDIFFQKTSTNSANIHNNNEGNVGIKNSSPAYTLDVSGDINFTGNFRKNGNIYGGNWNNLEGKPTLHRIIYDGHWNSLDGKPDYYDSKWSMLPDKPTLFSGEFKDLIEPPTFYPTNWDNIEKSKLPFAPIAYTGSYSDLLKDENLPELHAVAKSGLFTDLIFPTDYKISAVGFTGRYNDLIDPPILFSSNWNDIIDPPPLFDSNYFSLTNAPYIAFTYNNETKHLHSSNDGNVGIGVAVPASKLDVYGSINAYGNINITGTGNRFMIGNIAIPNQSASVSDSRIKINIADIEDTSALDKIMKIEPKNYNYIDTDERGTNNVIGFIAQQVKEVIPEAITIGEEYIPNIYKYYTIISSNMILVDDANINKIFIGNSLKIKVNNIPYITRVINKVNKTITIDIEIDVKSKCLIYGLKINDFHFIDKTYIYTLNVCATQEIYRRLEEQKNEIAELKSLVSKIVS
jgi:hypothetical protein